MKKNACALIGILFACTLVTQLIPVNAKAQLGIAYHQSNLSFVGVNYEIKSRFKPELRLSVNQYADDVSVEVLALYDVINKDDYELYVGIGARSPGDEGIVIPVGLNIYPLPFKNFGFHIELAAIAGDDAILRGSWGIRYRFLRRDK